MMVKNDSEIPVFDGIIFDKRPYAGMFLKKACANCKPKIDNCRIKYNQAIERAKVYETWPETYRGKIPLISGTEKNTLISDTQRSKESSKNQLIITSAFLYPECNAIHSMNFKTSEGIDGNYRYTEWTASGIPCVIKK